MLAHLGEDAPLVGEGDMRLIRQPLDFIGINYYTRSVAMSAEPANGRQPRHPVTDMGWEVFPDGLSELLARLDADYALPPLYIMENGAAYKDEVIDGRIADVDRIAYLRAHIAALAEAVETGVDVRGYFVWSLLDNFEWADGYTKRFGIVHVDYETQRRTAKDSAYWYREFLQLPMKPAKPGWRLVWSDDFEGDAIDRSKWDFDLGNGFFDYRNHAWVPGWGNEELQYYTDDPRNISVADSLLTIRVLKEPLHGCGYTSARIKTRRRDGTPLFTKRFGKFEFRAKVPHGKGLWPALWMLPQDDAYGAWAASGEIDVMEIVGERPREYLGSIHFGSTFPKRTLVTHVHTFAGTAARSATSMSTRSNGSPGEFAGASMECTGPRKRSGGAAARCATARASRRAAKPTSIPGRRRSISRSTSS